VCIREPAGNRAFDGAQLVLLSFPLPWAALWWMAAGSRYLRRRRGWIAGLAAWVGAVAAVGLALLLLAPERLARAVELLTA
jgi:hypothetical protein